METTSRFEMQVPELTDRPDITAVSDALKVVDQKAALQESLDDVRLGAVPTSRKINGYDLTADRTLSPADVGAVPTTRTINGKALSANIVLTAADVGALPTTDKGAAGGVATLGATGLVPVAQLPLPRVNLLDNPYFLDPLNTKGQASYTGNGYTIDRWLMNGGAANTLTIDENGLLFASTGASTLVGVVTQIIENAKVLSGKTITASFLFGEVQDGSYAMRLSYGAQTSYGNSVGSNGLSSLTLQLPEIDTLNFTLSANSATVQPTSCRPIAAKLELGDTQTLARKDAAGNWVLLDPPPDYGTELAKCQRFQIPLVSGDTAVARTSNGTDANVLAFFPTPTTLRARPALRAAASDFWVYHNGAYSIPTGVSVTSVTSNGVVLYFTIPSGIGIRQPVNVEYVGSGGILDANL